MRARFINENIEFERGINPKSAMGIGIRDKVIEDFIDELEKFFPFLHDENITKIHNSYIEFDLWPLSEDGMNELDEAIQKLLGMEKLGNTGSLEAKVLKEKIKVFKNAFEYVTDYNADELGMDDIYHEESIFIKIMI